MLLYLFAICKNPPKKILDNTGCTANDVLPAGVLYMSVKAPNITSNSYIDSESAAESAEKSLNRDGILIDDVEILCAMEKDLAGKYIPVSLKNDGSFGAYSKAESLEGFDNILSQIENTVKRLSAELKSGSANAVPLKRGKDSPCKYCKSKAICRRAVK
jgi:ATP-dependent helicase/nuclease subunit B